VLGETQTARDVRDVDLIWLPQLNKDARSSEHVQHRASVIGSVRTGPYGSCGTLYI
jgi:hypothetical protein